MKLAHALAGGLLLLVASWTAADEPLSPPPLYVIETSKVTASHKAVVITAVDLDAEGKLLAAAGDDHKVRIFRASDGEVLHTLRGHRDWVRAVMFSPDGKRLASAGDDHTIKIWDPASGALLNTIAASPRAIYALDWQGDGKCLACAGFDGKVRVLDTAAPGTLRHAFDGACRDMRCVTFSPDGTQVAVAGRTAQVRAWNLADGQMSLELSADIDRIRALAYTPDGNRVICAGDGRNVGVWDAHTGQKRSTLLCPTAKVLALAALDDELIVTGGSDNVVRIWNLRTGAETYRLRGHTGTVAALSCNRTVGLVVSGSYDTTIRVWKIDVGAQERIASPHRQELPLR